MGVTPAEDAEIRATIAANPLAGDVIPGLDGLRKLRFAFGGRGKRGGGRAVYFLMLADDAAALVFAYAKADREDMTIAQKKMLKQLMEEIRNG